MTLSGSPTHLLSLTIDDLLVVVQASSPCLLASLASLALLPLPLLAEPDADPAPDIGQLQQNGKIVNFTDSCLGKRQHCSTQVQMTRRTLTSPAWSTFQARHPARMDLGASPRCSSSLLHVLDILFFLDIVIFVGLLRWNMSTTWSKTKWRSAGTRTSPSVTILISLSSYQGERS